MNMLFYALSTSHSDASSMDNHVAIRMLLILAATIVLFAIVAMYSGKKDKRDAFRQNADHKRGGSTKHHERFDDYAPADSTQSMRPPPFGRTGSPPEASPSTYRPTDLVAPYPAAITTQESIATEQSRAQRRTFETNVTTSNRASTAAERSSSCHLKDDVKPGDLIPKDSADSRWARMNPSGQGDIQDQNFLSAGFNLGIDTQASSLRNANQQLRSEPSNPQVQVSPWMMSTIQPDTNRRPLEIGGDY